MGNYPTDVVLRFTLTGPESDKADSEVNDRLVALAAAAMGSKNQKRNWHIELVDGRKWEPMTFEQKLEKRKQNQEGMVSYADVSMPSAEDIKFVFKDVYGAEAQINMIVTRMRNAINSDFRFRSHGLLIGLPGCGKSYTLMKAKDMFEDENAVLVIDGTAMTSAGVIDLLKDIETMPRFIFIEEIDKAPNDAVSVLLGLMDKHGEIRKTTYRDKIEREARVCVFATANSLRKIQNMQEGALLSRFGNPITYNRADDAQLRMILHRELDDLDLHRCEKANGTGKRCGKCESCKHRGKWIDITLDWCNKHHDEMQADTLDPRFVIDLCLNGQDGLIDSSYLDDLEATSIKKTELEEWN